MTFSYTKEGSSSIKPDTSNAHENSMDSFDVCVYERSLWIIVNEQCSQTRKFSHVSRQGDPLSRYLSLICVRGFINLLRHVEAHNKVIGIHFVRFYSCYANELKTFVGSICDQHRRSTLQRFKVQLHSLWKKLSRIKDCNKKSGRDRDVDKENLSVSSLSRPVDTSDSENIL